MDKPYTVDQPLTGQRFPNRAPFSTWISPNNFGDFHPNPLMSLLTGNGQIEYPYGSPPAAPDSPSALPQSETVRLCITHRWRARSRRDIPIMLLVTNLDIYGHPPARSSSLEIRMQRRVAGGGSLFIRAPTTIRRSRSR